MLEDNGYVKASIEGHETAVKNRVIAFVDANQGETTDEQRVNLPKLKSKVQDAVDFVMSDLPAGVDRVDGYNITPVLIEVVNEKISALPVPEVSDEVV